LLRTFAGQEGPVPWVELHIGDEVMREILGCGTVGWAERVTFCRQMGIAALGVYDWNRFGSITDESLPVLHHKPLIRSAADLDKLVIPEPSHADLADEVKEAAKAMSGSGLAFFAEFAFGLDQTMADVGFDNLCLQFYDDAAFVHQVVGRYERYVAELIDLYQAMPEVDFLWIGEDLASKGGPFFSRATYERFFFPAFRRLAARIRKPWAFHSDGDVLPLLDEILSWHPAGLHPIEPGAMDILCLKHEIGDQVTLMGNLSVDLLTRGTPGEVSRVCRELLERCAPGGRYVFSSGNSIPDWAKPANVEAIARVVGRFNAEHYGEEVS
jgi:uroporphyrinogen-III decarboxylase